MLATTNPIAIALIFVPSLVAFGVAYLFLRAYHHATNGLARLAFRVITLSLFVLGVLLVLVEVAIVAS